jgi:tRNA 2-selenouridine synthase
VILEIDDFLKLRQTLATVDVRSENEYADGHMRGAVNIPILNNKERVEVGTDYKQKGQLEAIKTGFRLVGPRIADIIEAAEQVAQDRELLVHCWRGGMRSGNFCQFVGMAKIKTHQLQGGYKAYRHAALESYKHSLKLIVIGGSTGSGKSDILRELAVQGEQIIDLETLASHKGSVFGGLTMPPQPTTEQFQNDLFECIRGLDRGKRIWIEDESIAVGKIFIPEDFWRHMCLAPLVEIAVAKPIRIERLVNEYGCADREQFLIAMAKITKKLGGQHFNAAKEKLESDNMAAAIEILLSYYDKAYLNGLSKKRKRIIFHAPWDGQNLKEFVSQIISQKI